MFGQGGRVGHLEQNSTCLLIPHGFSLSSLAPVLLTNPDLAQGAILQYRINNVKGAARKAKSYGPVLDYEGLMYPWESAFTGDEVCPSTAATGLYEQHISGDISFAFQQYWHLKKDVEWLKTGSSFPTDFSVPLAHIIVAWPVIYGVAFFWETRVMFDRTLNQYVINGVIPPDEDAGQVNNSGSLLSSFDTFMTVFSDLYFSLYERRREDVLRLRHRGRYLPQQNYSAEMEHHERKSSRP